MQPTSRAPTRSAAEPHAPAQAVRAAQAKPITYLDISDGVLAALSAATLKYAIAFSTNGGSIVAGAAGVLGARFISKCSVTLPGPMAITATIALIAPGLYWFGSGTHAALTAAAFTSMALTRLKVANPAN